MAWTWIHAQTFRLAFPRSAQPETGDQAHLTRTAAGPVRSLPLTAGLPLVALFLLAGCAAPAVRPQRLVSKPNMLFSDSSMFTYNSARLLPQLEPGSASSGGAQNAGCTACR